ncbi:unnamed protein product, partial [Laminaria digitata]
ARALTVDTAAQCLSSLLIPGYLSFSFSVIVTMPRTKIPPVRHALSALINLPEVSGRGWAAREEFSYLIADDQKNWDELLMHAVAAHNNNVSRGTGLAPNEVHIGRYPRLPMTILEGRGVKGH